MENRHQWLHKLWAVGRGRLPLRRRGVELHSLHSASALDFDQWAQELAAGLSRREALRRLGAALVGSLLASLGLAPRAFGAASTNSRCQSFCRTTCGINPPGSSGFSRCISSCAQCLDKSGSLCACPAASGGPVGCCAPGNFCCNNQCRPCSCDKTVCAGSHGTSCCASSETCCDGACCHSGQYCCNNQCSVCPCGQTPCTGSHGTSCCAAGQTCCDGVCHDACGVLGSPCCGSQGFTCCKEEIGLTCCDGICCEANTHCENNVCVPGCLSNANCATLGNYVCCNGVCCDNTTHTCCDGVCCDNVTETCCNGACCDNATETCLIGICLALPTSG
jgi:hypothetical protein